MKPSFVQDRGISPVIGAVLLLAITLALAVFAAGFFLGLADETDPQPNVVLSETDSEDTTHRLVHDGGETLDGDRLELQGTLNPDAAAGKRLEDGDAVEFYPVSEEITVIWHGDNDESYRLTTLTVEQALPEPDVGCEWVEDRTDGGTDQIKIDGKVVNCDVQTDGQIKVRNDGVVVGNTVSDLKELDIDDGTVYGDATVENVLNVQDGGITGSATSETADVKIDNSEVDGSVTAEKVTEVQNVGVVDGDLRSRTKDTKVLSGSVVTGSVTAPGTVKITDSTVEGHVYADPADFDCTNSTINGEDCSSYSLRDPADW